MVFAEDILLVMVVSLLLQGWNLLFTRDPHRAWAALLGQPVSSCSLAPMAKEKPPHPSLQPLSYL